MQTNCPTLFMTETGEDSEAEVVLYNSVEEELTLLVDTSLEELCLALGKENNMALIDSECPTTVAGVEWVNKFVSGMSEDIKK